ncbi:hypothetical protein D3C74_303380 [compost metagenome]
MPDGEHAVAFFAFENIHLPDNPVNRQIHSARHEPGKGKAPYENQRSNQQGGVADAVGLFGDDVIGCDAHILPA